MTYCNQKNVIQLAHDSKPGENFDAITENLRNVFDFRRYGDETVQFMWQEKLHTLKKADSVWHLVGDGRRRKAETAVSLLWLIIAPEYKQTRTKVCHALPGDMIALMPGHEFAATPSLPINIIDKCNVLRYLDTKEHTTPRTVIHMIDKFLRKRFTTASDVKELAEMLDRNGLPHYLGEAFNIHIEYAIQAKLDVMMNLHSSPISAEFVKAIASNNFLLTRFKAPPFTWVDVLRLRQGG